MSLISSMNSRIPGLSSSSSANSSPRNFFHENAPSTVLVLALFGELPLPPTSADWIVEVGLLELISVLMAEINSGCLAEPALISSCSS